MTPHARASWRRLACVAIGAWGCWCAAAGADTVERRGTAEAVEGEVERLGPEGVTLRVARNGIDRTETIAWSDVRDVRGYSDGGLAAWLAAGEDAWRGRVRAQRGDWALALEPLQRAAARWVGTEPSPDGAASAIALTQALVQSGRLAEALPVAFEAMRHVRAGMPVPAWAADGAALLDAPRGVPAGIPPMALAGEHAARAVELLGSFDARGDGALAQAAAAYATLLEGKTAHAAVAPRATDADRQGLALIEALRDARSESATARSAGRRALGAMRRTLPAWGDAWIRFATGASLALEADTSMRERGAVLLVSVAVAERDDQPALARAAAEQAAGVVTALQAAASKPQAIPPAAPTPARPEDAVPRDLAEAVATRLDEMGAPDLLATHLEAQLEIAVTDEDRAAIVARLALLLAAQLESEPRAARRDQLLARSTRVVDRFDSGSEPLRLVLLRSQHRAAQRVAEDRRAGRVSDQEAAAAAEQFKALTRAFEALARRADTARLVTERDIGKSAGLQAELLGERSAQQEQVARSAQFFRAWSLYYRAWLLRDLDTDGWRDVAMASLTAFAQLIEPGRAAVDPSEVSVDLRTNEGFASAVLGSALAASLTQTGATADAWLALLESPGTHESVRLKLPAWRMASLLDRGEFERALALLAAEGDGPQGSPMALIAAARAAGDAAAPGAAALLTEAVARIAAAGRLSDLAAMSGVARAVGEGAGAGLFEGVRHAALAQRAQQAGDKAQAQQAWADASSALQRALDADPPPAIAAGARALQGWSLRGAGRLSDAADAFIASAASATGERAADTLWSAVLCLDEAARAGDAQANSRAQALVDRVAAEHGGTTAGVRAHAWRVVRSPTPGAADIDALLAPTVPAELMPAARKAALEGLYRRFRSVQGAERLAAARRALAVSDGELVSPGDDGTLELRRRLEMSVAVDDRTRAAEALAGIEARTERSATLAAALAPELAARRAQVAALDRRGADAILAVQALEPSSVWGRIGWRAARDAVARDGASSAAQRATVARAVVHGWADASAAPVQDVVAWVSAEAALASDPDPDSRSSGDPVGAAKVLADARVQHPKDADLALADAELQWARGDRTHALLVLRTALAQLEPGSRAWFTAKAMQVKAASLENPAQARAMLEQVRQLAGGFGEGEAAAQLQALDRSLPEAVP